MAGALFPDNDESQKAFLAGFAFTSAVQAHLDQTRALENLFIASPGEFGAPPITKIE